MHYRIRKDPETQRRNSDLLVRRCYLISESAMSLENRMQKRLLPQSPISCEHKLPTQKRPKAREKLLQLLLAMAPCHYSLLQCMMQFQKVEKLVASNP